MLRVARLQPLIQAPLFPRGRETNSQRRRTDILGELFEKGVLARLSVLWIIGHMVGD